MAPWSAEGLTHGDCGAPGLQLQGGPWREPEMSKGALMAASVFCSYNLSCLLQPLC